MNLNKEVVKPTDKHERWIQGFFRFNLYFLMVLQFFGTTMLNIFIITTSFFSCFSQNNIINYYYHILQLFCTIRTNIQWSSNILRWNSPISFVTEINFLNLCECNALAYYRTHNININNNTENLTSIAVICVLWFWCWGRLSFVYIWYNWWELQSKLIIYQRIPLPSGWAKTFSLCNCFCLYN